MLPSPSAEIEIEKRVNRSRERSDASDHHGSIEDQENPRFKKGDYVEIINMTKHDYDNFNGSIEVGMRYRVIGAYPDEVRSPGISGGQLWETWVIQIESPDWRNYIPQHCCMLYKKAARKRWWQR